MSSIVVLARRGCESSRGIGTDILCRGEGNESRAGKRKAPRLLILRFDPVSLYAVSG